MLRLYGMAFGVVVACLGLATLILADSPEKKTVTPEISQQDTTEIPASDSGAVLGASTAAASTGQVQSPVIAVAPTPQPPPTTAVLAPPQPSEPQPAPSPAEAVVSSPPKPDEVPADDTTYIEVIDLPKIVVPEPPSDGTEVPG